jgi:hypothetical protein
LLLWISVSLLCAHEMNCLLELSSYTGFFSLNLSWVIDYLRRCFCLIQCVIVNHHIFHKRLLIQNIEHKYGSFNSLRTVWKYRVCAGVCVRACACVWERERKIGRGWKSCEIYFTVSLERKVWSFENADVGTVFQGDNSMCMWTVLLMVHRPLLVLSSRLSDHTLTTANKNTVQVGGLHFLVSLPWRWRQYFWNVGNVAYITTMRNPETGLKNIFQQELL